MPARRSLRFDSDRASSGPAKRLALGVGLLLSLICGQPSRAHAGSVLVLGFVEDGKPNAAMRQSVMQFLSRMGEEVVASPLSATDQLCTQTDCLVRLGERHRAQRLVGGELIRNDTSYRINVWLFDRVSELPNSAEATCTDCNAEMLADMLGRTVGRALEVGVPPPAPPPPSSSSSLNGQRTALAAEPAQVSRRACGSKRGFLRGLALGSLSATTAAGLATGIGLAASHGQVYQTGEGGMPDRVYDFGTHTGVAFGLTAVSAVGLALTAVPWSRVLYGRRNDTEVCTTSSRWTFARGVAVGSLGALAAMGLTSALALTAMNGATYDVNADGTPITYSLKPHYTTASVLSAGMLVGLGVALFWP